MEIRISSRLNAQTGLSAFSYGSALWESFWTYPSLTSFARKVWQKGKQHERKQKEKEILAAAGKEMNQKTMDKMEGIHNSEKEWILEFKISKIIQIRVTKEHCWSKVEILWTKSLNFFFKSIEHFQWLQGHNWQQTPWCSSLAVWRPHSPTPCI